MNDLLVVGAYISSKDGEEILYEALTRLYGMFDIALVTHTPVSERVQKLVKYFIYDQRNELMTMEVSTMYWGNYPTFYYEIYPDGSRKYHSFAVYRSITNAVKLLSSDYDSFTYVEGDWWFSPEDALKLKRMKSVAKENGKRGMFVSYGDFLNINYFYCTMDLVKNVFKLYDSKEEYIDGCKQIGSHGQLENYLYKAIEQNNILDEVIIMNGINAPGYFESSKGDLSRFSGNNAVGTITYNSNVLKLYGTNELVFMYINPTKPENAPVAYEMKLDGEYVTMLSTDVFSVAFVIKPKNNNFLIEIGPNKFYYEKNNILSESNKSFIKLK